VKLPAQAGGENVGVLRQLSCTQMRLVWKSFAACREQRYRFIPGSPPAVTLVILHQLLICFSRIRHERCRVR